MEWVPTAPKPMLVRTVPFETVNGRPSGTPASKSWTWPVGLTADVTVIVKAKLFVVEGNLEVFTEMLVWVAAAPPPPPPPPELPPQPKV